MPEQYFITSSVRIKENKIFSDGKALFSSEDNEDLNTFLKAAYQYLKISYPKFHKMDGLCKMGILATEVLFSNKNLSPDTALVFANSSSSLETDKKHVEMMKETVSPAVFVYTLPNIVLGEISIRHGLRSENAFFISEKFDGGLLKGYTQILLDTSKATGVVCGWIEWKNDQYDVFLCLISAEGDLSFSEENLVKLYRFENE